MIRSKRLHTFIQLFHYSFLCSTFFLLSLSINAQNDTVLPDKTELPHPYEQSEDQEGEGDFFLLKDQFPERVIHERSVPDSITAAMKQDEDFWYANATVPLNKNPDTKAHENQVPLNQRTWFKTLFWLIIIGGFAAALIWFLADSNAGLFRRRVRTDLSVSEEANPENIFGIHYQKEIDKAVARGDFRLAIRLMFLQLLKHMAEYKVISYKQDKTNFDYLLELQATRYYPDFFRITRNYEYSWYGQFEVKETTYRIIRSDFEKLERMLRHN